MKIGSIAKSNILQRKVYKMMSSSGSFKDLKFTNTAVNELRIDPNNSNETRQVNGFHYSLTPITGLKNPSIVAISEPACQLLDLDPEKLRSEADYLIGNKLPAEAKVKSSNQANLSLLCRPPIRKFGRSAR